jgi:opacity protein-like surface antigen
MQVTNLRFLCVRLASIVAIWLLAAAASAQEAPEGFYIGINAGIAASTGVDSSTVAATNPTKCDRLLYADPAMAPSGAPECMDNTLRVLSSTGFSPGPGFTGGASAGYGFRPVRIEFEYRARMHGDEVVPILSPADNQPQATKVLEWSPVDPPVETLSAYKAHQFFANVHVDLASNSRWTPSVGAGVGVARTSLGYTRRAVRKTLAQGYQNVEAPLTLADRPAAAAGTLSLLESTVSGTLFGYQLLGGLDYRVSERSTVGISAHWARFGGLQQDVVWSIIRSHEPVRADGVTPFTSEVTLDNLKYWAVTLSMKHYF